MTSTFIVIPNLVTPAQNVFGTGADGNVTISVNTTLLRIYNYNNLTIAPGIFVFAPFKIYVAGILTIGAGGNINFNGGNSTGTSPGTYNLLPYTPPYGTNNFGTQGGSLVGVLGAYGGKYVSGIGNSAIVQYEFNPFLPMLPTLEVSTAGGLGATSSLVTGSGGAGCGGGILIIAAKNIVTDGVTVSLSAMGGNGGNATTSSNANGGSGGAGGAVFLVSSMSAASIAPSVIASVIGGTAGTADGSGTVGTTGNNGIMYYSQYTGS